MPRLQIVIENPILNTPYDAPVRHFDPEGEEEESPGTSTSTPPRTRIRRVVAIMEVTDLWEAGGMIEAVIGQKRL